MQDPKDLLEFYQEKVLEKVFGELKWGNNRSEITAPWHCPKCNSSHGFRRRGSRPKIIRYNNEKIAVKLFQVTCMQCDSTFSPFPELFGLEKNEQIYQELFDFKNFIKRGISW